MAVDAPPEIWTRIIDLLPCEDQFHISQVSAQLCAVARSIIFRDVDLRNDKDAAQATIALLSRDHNVASSVERLHLHTVKVDENGQSWFDVAALAGLARLRHLELTGPPYLNKRDQIKFQNGLLKSCSALKELHYCYPGGDIRRQYKRDISLTFNLEIQGLEQLTWSEIDAFSFHRDSSPILCIANASSQTLTHIRIPCDTEWWADWTTLASLTAFFNLRFPCLQVLQLGGWAKSGEDVPSNISITQFLTHHPLLEDLCLDVDHDDLVSDVRSGHLSMGTTLEPGMLPRLRHLKVDAFNLAVFAQNRLSFLRTLETLHVFNGEGEDLGFEDMYQSLGECGGLPELKRLTLELGNTEDYPDAIAASWVAGLGDLCPQVERFRGDSTVGWLAVEPNQVIFASYRKLKILELPDQGSMVVHEDEVKKFAAQNPSVTELRFYGPSDAADIRFHYRLERNADCEITSIVEVL